MFLSPGSEIQITLALSRGFFYMHFYMVLWLQAIFQFIVQQVIVFV